MRVLRGNRDVNFFVKAAMGFMAAFVLFGSSVCEGASIGTFNIKMFNARLGRYGASDCEAIARVIGGSGVSLLALQEIEGDFSMRALVRGGLEGWKFCGNDTMRDQDLYFLWDPGVFRKIGGPMVAFVNDSFEFEGVKYRLFERPPLVAVFEERASKRRFVVVNVHLKSQLVFSFYERDSGLFNDLKRMAQVERLNGLVESYSMPVFVMGDFNVDPVVGAGFGLLQLGGGEFSFPSSRSNLDYVGFYNLTPSSKWRLRKIEPLSSEGLRLSDHNMVVLDFSF